MIGKFIDSSGLPKLMVDSELLAEGSLKGFLTGTHFNRCKKIHPVAALSLKILHFKTFLKLYGEKTHSEKQHLNEVIEILMDDLDKRTTTNVKLPQLKDILEQYNNYYDETIKGNHGHTAQFALMYVSLVELFQLFEPATCTCTTMQHIKFARCFSHSTIKITQDGCRETMIISRTSKSRIPDCWTSLKAVHCQ